jgi:hypothetical protein
VSELEQKVEELRSTMVLCTSAILEALMLVSPAICQDRGMTANQIRRIIERLPAP